MNSKKLVEVNTPEELVEAFVFPVKLSAKGQLEADEQLAEHREKKTFSNDRNRKNYISGYCN